MLINIQDTNNYIWWTEINTKHTNYSTREMVINMQDTKITTPEGW